MARPSLSLIELTRRAHTEFMQAGRVDLSLRTIGARIGVSARMLVHYFESREKLVISVLEYERAEQQRLIGELMSGGFDPIPLLRRVFRAMTEPNAVDRLRFFFDLVAEANRDRELYADFLSRDLVGYWREMMLETLRFSGVPDPVWDMPSIALACARGLYIEVLAEGDVADVRRRYDRLLDLIGPNLGL